MIMETEINIAEILKDKPNGTKLYADAFGELSFKCITPKCSIYTEGKTSIPYTFYNDGKYNKYGEPILVPSKKMHDWSKFAWKKGDVLVSDDGKNHVIFSRWYDDNYTAFYGKHYLNNENKNKALYYRKLVCTTEIYSIEYSIETYINAIEEKLGGKLNFKTLEIEKTQLEFKDGDIVFVRCKRYCFIEIFNYFKKDDLKDHASLNTTLQMIDIGGEYPIFKDEIVEIRPATEKEKQQLFDALAKKGYAWDAEKKQIVDLKPKIELKPFDRVLVRNRNTQRWDADLFGFKSIFYHCVGGSWNFCIPYIGNESLLGTTKGAEK